ncbi:Fc receptor-like protein 5 [Pyxicephalus adspersus]
MNLKAGMFVCLQKKLTIYMFIICIFSTGSALCNTGGTMFRLQIICQLIILFILIGWRGSAARPVVMLQPHWNTILRDDFITMSCNAEPAASHYEWYHNNNLISSSKYYIIISAKTEDNGDYWCSANIGGTSEKITLSVTDGPVILQAPLYVYEGDDVSLRCHSPRGHSARQTIFYRNNQIIRTSAIDPDLLPIKYTELTDTYRCTKQIQSTIYSSADITISYTELFSKPAITAIPYSNITTAGNTMTLVCNTNLSLLRMKTELQFAFYRDGQEVRNFSLSNQYEIRSAQLEDSGNYFCEVRNSNNNVRKRSEDLYIQVKGSAARLMVMLQPHWKTILRDDFITMSCNVEPAASYYEWYHNTRLISLSKDYAIVSAKTEDNGDYWCSTNIGGTSEKITLSVTDGPVILQAPLYVYEGDDVSLRCHSPQERSARQTIFYRNNQKIQTSATDPDLLPIKYTDLTDTYRCTKQIQSTIYSSANITISYTELFSKPDITAIPYSNITTAGTTMTLVCNTNLSRLRMKTELQFAFYRDGQEVKNFSSSNKYKVQSAQLEDSGNYSCEVRNANNNVRKRSEELFIQIQVPEVQFLDYLLSFSGFRMDPEKRYIESVEPSSLPPAPAMVHGNQEFQLARIVDPRNLRRSLQYLVHCKGYGPEERMWIPATDVYVRRLVKALHRANPEKLFFIILFSELTLCKMSRMVYRLLLLLIILIGSSSSPVMIFKPNWKRILIGESITMSCIVETSASYHKWYHNDQLISSSKDNVISFAETRHSGDYWCSTNTGGRSEKITLSVSNGPVILQAPLYVYEGDDVPLRCHSPQGRSTRQTIFYRNNQIIQTSATDPDLLPIKYTDLTDTYRCTKKLLTTYNYSDETTVSYTASDWTIHVSFQPNWNKLLIGESITMTCHGESHLTYHWFRNNVMVAEGPIYTIKSAWVENSGMYQCQTNLGKSAAFRLDVSDGPLILQAPVLVYSGTDVNLRCHSRPEYSVHRTTFYKSYNVILGSLSDHSTYVLPRDSYAPGRYRCVGILSRDEYVSYTDEVSLHVRELFSKPDITAIPYSNKTTAGNTMTLVCNTNLSLLRMKTELQFAFYRDGQEVKNFSSANKYKVNFAQLEDSGNYSCEVRVSSKSVSKMSEDLYIQVQEDNSKNTLSITVIIRISILFIANIVIVVVIKYKWINSKTPTSMRPAMDTPDTASLPEATQNHVVYSEIQARMEPERSSIPGADALNGGCKGKWTKDMYWDLQIWR